MKKFCISFTLFLIITLSAAACVVAPRGLSHAEYLRIHIRADSNERAAQEVKYRVKDAVVEFLTPLLSECDDKSKAENVLNGNLAGIRSVADKVLNEQGFTYKSTVRLCEEEFPTRNYGDYTLEEGFYDALIIELGSGEGDNWWCVVYPPLCFTGSGKNCVYKSKILEIIRNFYG
ncbi:MAG: stage II sporulation protein R [Clostridia bacterium]|nr:stage II sporulation protein R [Clostridia bacterium]